MKVHPAGGSWRGPGLGVLKEGQGGKVYGRRFVFMDVHGFTLGICSAIVATDGIRDETIP